MKTIKASKSMNVRAFIVKAHPEEKDFLGDFSKGVTFGKLADRMIAGENFYDVCDCTESVQREICFNALVDVFPGTKYADWYDLWLYCGEEYHAKKFGRVAARVKKLMAA